MKQTEALRYWNDNLTDAVVSKEVFLQRVENWAELNEALREFYLNTNNVNIEEKDIENKDEDIENDNYFNEVIGQVEEEGENLEIFWENIKAPLGA